MERRTWRILLYIVVVLTFDYCLRASRHAHELRSRLPTFRPARPSTSASATFMSELEEVFARRRKSVAEKCFYVVDADKGPRLDTENVIYLKELNMTYCHIEGIDSGAFRTHLESGLEQRNISIESPDHKLSSTNYVSSFRSLESTTTVVWVMHPFARLVTTYENMWPTIRSLLLAADKNKVNHRLESSFPAFVSVLLNGLGSLPMDPAPFRPQWIACDVCADLDPDVVAMAETQFQDNVYLSKKFSLPLSSAHSRSASSQFDLTEVTMRYFAMLTSNQANGLTELYLRDFEIFGYDWWHYVQAAKHEEQN